MCSSPYELKKRIVIGLQLLRVSMGLGVINGVPGLELVLGSGLLLGF